MNSSKKCSKLGVKLLASVLSVITLCPGITPYVNAANSKTLRSGNYITRKVKNVGLRADSFIKRKYIELCSLIKNNPKTTIAVGTTVGLVIIGTISVVCYKSHKDKKGAEEPVTGEQKSEDSEAEQHGAGETEEPNTEKIVTGEPETKESKTGEQKSEDSKTEQQGAGESKELSKLREERKLQLAEVREGFEELSKEIKDVIQNRRSTRSPKDKEITGKLESLQTCIKNFLETLSKGGAVCNSMEIYGRRYDEFLGAINDAISNKEEKQRLTNKFRNANESLATRYSWLRDNYDKITELSAKIQKCETKEQEV